MVHLRYSYDDDLSFEDNEDLHSHMNYSEEIGKSYGSAWRHLICLEDCSENRLDERKTYGDPEKVHWRRAHQFCNPVYTEQDPYKPPIQFYDHETMRLSILRVSNQVYFEANRVLWTSNTFSFADATTFKRFMMTRNTTQKRLLQNIRLDMNWYMHSYEIWNSCLNLPLVRPLPGLRTLRLHISHREEAEIYQHTKTYYDFIHGLSYCEGLKKLSILPFTSVEVAVRIPQYMSEDGLWGVRDREELAYRLQKMLLNPRGADDYYEARRKEQEDSRRYRELLAEARASMFRSTAAAQASAR